MNPNTELTDEQIARGRRFLRDLRSNPVKAVGAMRRGEGRCCLCVAYDTAQADGAELPLHTDVFPPEQIADWYGWDRWNPSLIYEDEVRDMSHFSASHLNDGEYAPILTHEEIADAFEETYPQLKEVGS